MDFKEALTKRKTLIAVTAFCVCVLILAFGYSRYALDGSRLRNAASVAIREGHLAEAEDLLKKAKVSDTARFGVDSLGIAEAENSLGRLYSEMGSYERAEPLANVLTNYAEMLAGAGRGAEAVSVQRRAVRLVAGR